MDIQRTIPARVRVILLLAVLPACSGGGLGTLGDILGAGLPGQAQQGELRAEVQQVDTRQQQIQIRTEDGRTGTVFYDQSTEVIYQQQRYPVSALERGDLVALEVQQDQSGRLYATRVHVEQSVQERTGRVSGTQQLREIEGRVGQIDHQRGVFQLQPQHGGTVTVSLPYNPPPATEDRFHALRTGDVVRIEGTYLDEGRVELYRFR